LAWLDGSLLVAPSRCQRNWSLSHHNVSYSTGIDQQCIQKYARHWWIECASKYFPQSHDPVAVFTSRSIYRFLQWKNRK
jgi:hypothetical protein